MLERRCFAVGTNVGGDRLEVFERVVADGAFLVVHADSSVVFVRPQFQMWLPFPDSRVASFYLTLIL